MLLTSAPVTAGSHGFSSQILKVLGPLMTTAAPEGLFRTNPPAKTRLVAGDDKTCRPPRPVNCTGPSKRRLPPDTVFTDMVAEVFTLLAASKTILGSPPVTTKPPVSETVWKAKSPCALSMPMGPLTAALLTTSPVAAFTCNIAGAGKSIDSIVQP